MIQITSKKKLADVTFVYPINSKSGPVSFTEQRGNISYSLVGGIYGRTEEEKKGPTYIYFSGRNNNISDKLTDVTVNGERLTTDNVKNLLSEALFVETPEGSSGTGEEGDNWEQTDF